VSICFVQLQKQFRRRRASALLKLVATYDYACFRCSRQRQAQNSLRIGISPDSTLAYIDFLFDEEYFRTRTRPLCPVGQVKLPATFKVAGLGTYFSPYFIDTNDLILQAVPQTDIPSYFINDAWIRFVVELNTVLRTVQAGYLHLGVHKLTRFLSDEQHIVDLGGLVVEFCTFSNNEKDSGYDERRERDKSQQQQLTPLTAPAPGSPTSSSDVIRRNTDTGDGGRERLDSFGFNTGARKSEDGGNWLTNLVDFSAWSSGPRPAKRSPTGPVEIELRDSSFKAGGQTSIVSRGSAVSAVGAPTTTRLVPEHRPPLTGIAGYIARNYTYVRDRITKFFASGYKAEDPAGKTLSFHEMCNAIQEGNLTMGIIVTHPKVDINNYIVQDDDYESEEDEFYEEDLAPAVMKGHDSQRGLLQLRSLDSDEEEGSSDEERRRRALSTMQPSDSETEGPDSPIRTASNATDLSVNLGLSRVYGNKAEEMQRFYNIMLNAEASSQLSSPVSTPAVLLTTRKSPSNSNLTSMVVPASPSTSSPVPPSPAAAAPPPKPSRRASALPLANSVNPLRPAAGKAQRRASALPTAPSLVASTKPSANTVPETETAADSAPSAVPTESVQDEAPAPAATPPSPPPRKESPQLTSFKGRSRSRTRSGSASGSDAGSDTLAPAASKSGTRPRSASGSTSQSGSPSSSSYTSATRGRMTLDHGSTQTGAEGSDHSYSEDSGGPRQARRQSKGPVKKAVASIEARIRSSGTRTKIYYCGTDGAVEVMLTLLSCIAVTDMVGGEHTPRSGSPVRRPSSSGSSDDHDTAGDQEGLWQDARSRPVSVRAPAARDSESPHSAEEGDDGPTATESAAAAAIGHLDKPSSLRFSSFRHSDVSGSGSGSDEEGDSSAAVAKEGPALPPLQALPVTPTSSVQPSSAPGRTRPTLQRGDSTKSVSPKERDTQEYTEFQSTERTRKPTFTTFSGGDDVSRFSDFRHSDVYDDRESEFAPSAQPRSTRSTKANLVRYSDAGDEHEWEEDAEEHVDESPSMFARDSSVEDPAAAQVTQVPLSRARNTTLGGGRLKKRATKPPAAPTSAKMKRSRSKRIQKDLSRVNLAPSAHQQEFNTWRLLSNTPVPVSDRGGLNGRPISKTTRMSLAAGAAGGLSPLHQVGDNNRDSVMADRSSMITADDRAVDMEEGEVVNFENPLARQRSNRIVSVQREDMRSADAEGVAPYTGRRDRPVSTDLGPLKWEAPDLRLSDDSTVHTDTVQSTTATTMAEKTLEETFRAIYSTRVVFMVISRFMFGGNVYPLGPRSVRRFLEVLLLVLSVADVALSAIICFEYYCISSNTTSCNDHTDLTLVIFVWPFAMMITPLLGIFAIMLGPSGTLTRIYAMWNRLTGVNNLIVMVVYLRYFKYLSSLAITTYPPILYTCSRGIQCLVVDQYIAHIEKLRYTRGWDGLHTSLFKTQDSKTVITDGK
jgi:hypothetical protein